MGLLLSAPLPAPPRALMLLDVDVDSGEVTMFSSGMEVTMSERMLPSEYTYGDSCSSCTSSASTYTESGSSIGISASVFASFDSELLVAFSDATEELELEALSGLCPVEPIVAVAVAVSSSVTINRSAPFNLPICTYHGNIINTKGDMNIILYNE